jgi:predicted ribonuclease YlaK
LLDGGNAAARSASATGDPPQDFPRLFFSEVEAQHAVLQELLEELKGVRDRLVRRRSGAIIVPDANVFLHYTFFKEASWTALTGGEPMRMVVPLLVIEQLDRTKTSQREHIARRAQQVIRALEDLLATSRGPAEIPGRGTIEVLVDEPGHVRCAVDDEEIVDVCRYVADVTGQRARLVTGDLGMSLRASQLGVEVCPVPEDWRLRS